MTTIQEDHQGEVDRGERFQFGKNWSSYVQRVDDQRVAQAVASLRDMLAVSDLSGQRFLDIGCGSGLFSLAARELGAQVHSFDYDPDSVAAATQLRSARRPNDPDWTIERGSVLDADYLRGLGRFDVVYSWGVLHHTGAMWRAIEQALIPLAPGGQLFIALYNDQGATSRRWRKVKQTYCSGTLGRGLVLGTFVPWFFARTVFWDLVSRRPPWRTLRDYRRDRGMSVLHDWVDWLGGFPFEVAKPDQVVDFLGSRGLSLERLRTCGGELGNNEFVFRRRTEP